MSRDPAKLLFLACPFPPGRASGAVRCASLAKHLSRQGWQVTVATIDPQLIANPDPAMQDRMEEWCRETGIQRVLTGHDWRMLYGGGLVGRWWERPAPVRKLAPRLARAAWIDPGLGWVRPVLAACAHLRPGDVDVVLSSGSPFPAFTAACRLGRRLNAGVVLDYRDLWSLSPLVRRSAPVRVVRTEQDLLNQAAAVFTVSDSMGRCLGEKFGCGGKITVVTNGFDPDDFRGIVPAVFSRPTIVYAGSFYPPLRTIHPVLAAIGRANRSGRRGGKEIRLLYLGSQPAHVQDAARELDAAQWVDIGGRVPRQEVLAALKGALAAAVITSVYSEATPEADSILTGKLFEAMGAGARVLLVAPSGTEAERVVLQTRAGRSFSGTDVDGMAAWFAQLVGHPAVEPRPEVEAYAWPEIARKADAALQRVARRRI